MARNPPVAVEELLLRIHLILCADLRSWDSLLTATSVTRCLRAHEAIPSLMGLLKMAEKPPSQVFLFGHTYHIPNRFEPVFLKAVQIGWGEISGFGSACRSCVCFAAGALLGWVAINAQCLSA